jgi:ParB-like chromosome segregation protein Spo0J
MSKLKIVEVPVEDLIPYANNARTHSDEQVAQIAASIREFGWTNPILVDGKNGIIAGHGRLAAARKLKIDKVPAIQLDELSEAQKKALILADNKLALNSGWDYDLLKVELDQLSEIGFDLQTIGFDANELSTIMFSEELEEKTPEEKEMKSVYEIAVECKDENEQQNVFDMLTEKGYKCRVLTM